jgi:hypothetical protein
MIFSFGGPKHERIEIDVRYERPPSGDYHDDNWLTAGINVSAGSFRAKAEVSMLTDELVSFLGQLQILFKTLEGPAELITLEQQIYLRLTGNGKGHIELKGELGEMPEMGNRLHFELNFDQTELGASIRELEKVTTQFPIR